MCKHSFLISLGLSFPRWLSWSQASLKLSRFFGVSGLCYCDLTDLALKKEIAAQKSKAEMQKQKSYSMVVYSDTKKYENRILSTELAGSDDFMSSRNYLSIGASALEASAFELFECQWSWV